VKYWHIFRSQDTILSRHIDCLLGKAYKYM